MTTLTLDTLFADTPKEDNPWVREIIISIKNILKESFIKAYSPSCVPSHSLWDRNTIDTKTQKNDSKFKQKKEDQDENEDEDKKEIKRLEGQIQKIKKKNKLTEEIQKKKKEIQELTTSLEIKKKKIIDLEIELNLLLEQIHKELK